jgi:hypothetical protein
MWWPIRLWNVRRRVGEIADPMFQEWAWVRGNHPSSFIEVNCGLFDDMDFPDMLNVAEREGLMSDEVLREARDFLQALDDFRPTGVQWSPEDLVTHPE